MMTVFSETLEVKHAAGLHLRPAALFVQTSASFDADILVCNATRETEYKNAKSTIDVMMLGVEQGHRITIQAEGEDAEAALTALAELVQTNFGENK
jgi:phosphotransferase system HPr (HPr) family protein